MEFINSTSVFEFPSTTIEDIRKMYNLDQPGRMNEAIDILEDWIKKQNHFVNQSFSRDYLERCIINCKGSVERAKLNIEKLCTLRALLPKSFLEFNDLTFEKIKAEAISVMLPKFAPNYKRVFITKCSVKQRDPAIVHEFYKYSLALCDYLKSHDYSDGLVAILDYRDMSITDFVTSINLMEFQLIMNLYIEGYSVRMKGIHIVTSSKVVDLLVKLLKQVVSAKIRDRLHVHRSIEELHDVVPRDILPAEYGGQEKSLEELQAQWCAVLNTKEHREFIKQMNEIVSTQYSKTKPSSDDNLGMSGTFRTLVLD